MDKLIKFVGVVFTGSFLIAFVAVLSGTILWLVWPAAASIFPAAIQSGYFIAHISWWQAVALSWAITLIFKVEKPKATINE